MSTQAAADALRDYMDEENTQVNGSTPAQMVERVLGAMPEMHHFDDVSRAFNAACDDILKAIDAPDEGVRDALNLLVNAGLHYLRPDTSDDLDEAIAGSYAIEPGEDGPIEWAKVAC